MWLEYTVSSTGEKTVRNPLTLDIRHLICTRLSYYYSEKRYDLRGHITQKVNILKTLLHLLSLKKDNKTIRCLL